MSKINLSDLPQTEIVDVHIASPGGEGCGIFIE